MHERDICVLLDLERPGLTSSERRELIERILLHKEGVRTCYVAVDKRNGAPCYMQWLIGSDENLSLKRIFRGGFPWLKPNEVLAEDAFTAESYRGLGIMSCAMAKIAEREATTNVRYVIGFVHNQNVASLKSCQRAGFVPYMIRKEKNFFFRRSITFLDLPLGTPYPFDAGDRLTHRCDANSSRCSSQTTMTCTL
jgi:hypothetical protein